MFPASWGEGRELEFELNIMMEMRKRGVGVVKAGVSSRLEMIIQSREGYHEQDMV